MQQVLCRYCGEEVPEGAKSCPKCGTTVLTVQNAEVSAELTEKVRKKSFVVGVVGFGACLAAIMFLQMTNRYREGLTGDSISYVHYYLSWSVGFLGIWFCMLGLFGLSNKGDKKMLAAVVCVATVSFLITAIAAVGDWNKTYGSLTFEYFIFLLLVIIGPAAFVLLGYHLISSRGVMAKATGQMILGGIFSVIGIAMVVSSISDWEWRRELWVERSCSLLFLIGAGLVIWSAVLVFRTLPKRDM